MEVLTGKKPFGSLDRLRENLEVLDEQIATARVMSKKKGKDANALQWSKTLRDLIELRNETLERIKAHLLGRNENGVVKEPEDVWPDGNADVEYERSFQNCLAPWSQQRLKLKCEECGVNSLEVSARYIDAGEYLDLCEKCYNKRTELECEDCHKSSNDVRSRDMGSEYEDQNLCSPCYEKFQSEQSNESGTGDEEKDSDEDDESKDVANPASRDKAEELRESVVNRIMAVSGLPREQRIAKLTELLAEKVEVAPGLESTYNACKILLQKELDEAKTESS